MDVTEQELREMLYEGPVQITFLKRNDTERVINCSFLVPADFLLMKVEYVSAGDGGGYGSVQPGNHAPGRFVVWDLDKKEFRSFNFNQVLGVELGALWGE